MAHSLRYYKCFLCGSLFSSPQEADRCCRRAKAQVLCERLRQKYGGEEVEYHCNVIRAGMLKKSGRIGRFGRGDRIECAATAL